MLKIFPLKHESMIKLIDLAMHRWENMQFFRFARKVNIQLQSREVAFLRNTYYAFAICNCIGDM